MNGVIQTSTGDLLRAGYCDFQNDGSFDSLTETYKTDVPQNAKIKYDRDETLMSRWSGTAWIEVAQPAKPPNYKLKYSVPVLYGVNGVPVIEVLTWQVIGAIKGNPGFVANVLSKTIGSVLMDIKTLGTAAEVRVTQDDILYGTVQILPDTANAIQELKFYVPAPTIGTHTYKLEARLNGSTSCIISLASLTLLEDIN